MTVEVPDWATSVPSVDVHSLSANAQTSSPMSWQQLQATVQFFLDSFIGQIAIAFGGISILGWKPFEFLKKWGEDQVTKASEAYTKAVSAESAATDVDAETSKVWSGLGTLESGLHALQALFAVHDRKIADLAMQLNTAGEETGGTDPCDNTAAAVNIIGDLDASVYGWWYSLGDPASFLYDPTLRTPAGEHVKTERHGVGAVFTSKQPGVTRIDMACNATKTNGGSLQIKVNNWRKDEVSVGYLTGPNAFVAVKTIKYELPKDSVWQIWYHPGDPDDPADPWANTFFVMCNSEEIRELRWTDGGNFVQHGPDFRWTGGCCNAADDWLTRGPAITEFAYYDYLKAVPE